MVRLIKDEHYEKKLEQARDELGQRLDAMSPVMERIMLDFDIPLEKGSRKWNQLISDLDYLLMENFNVDIDAEDM